MYSTGIILLLTITASIASHIEGLWQVNRSNEMIEIRSTNNGIKAKYVDSGSWDFYETLRNDRYEDRKGNRYILQSSDQLLWESRDGRRVMNFQKAQSNSSRRGNYNNGRNNGYGSRNNGHNDDYRNSNRNGQRYDDYGNSNRNRQRYDDYGSYNGQNDEYCGPNCADNCTDHKRGKRVKNDRYLRSQLSGTYTNRWKRTNAYVEYDGYTLKMKTNRSRKWTTYSRTHHKKLVFEDRWGNKVKFKKNGQMEWKRADNGRHIDFHKTY